MSNTYKLFYLLLIITFNITIKTKQIQYILAVHCQSTTFSLTLPWPFVPKIFVKVEYRV